MSAKEQKPKTKRWEDLVVRSARVHRAQQLGFDEVVNGSHSREEGRSIHLLFVCSRNQWRSPTAERIYDDHPLIETRSAGTASSARRKLSLADIQWADLILVMEREHAQRVRADFREAVQSKELHVLGIEDRYRYMDPELVAEIKAAVDPILALF